jgi:hypothetical protein
MQGKLIILLFVLWSGVATAQNYSVNEPRMRVNRTASLSLTTDWQTLSFNGTSDFNFNTYAIDPTSGNKMIWYDTSANLFKVYGEYDKQLSFQLFIRSTTNIITTSANLQYRIVIPNGISPGVPLNFPFPEDGGYGYLISLTRLTTAVNNTTTPIAIYANSAIRTNGFYVQVRLSNPLFALGTSTINSASVVIQSKS